MEVTILGREKDLLFDCIEKQGEENGEGSYEGLLVPILVDALWRRCSYCSVFIINFI